MNSQNARPMTFSVVIPTFKRRELVLQALASVARQTFPAYEVIVVVDGSDDGTADAVRAAYPATMVIEQQNGGLAVARNTGLSRATGEWVCFLDDDDLWHPEKLRSAVEHFTEHPECEALIHPAWFFTSTDSGPKERIGLRRDFVASTLEECIRQADERGLDAPEEGARLAGACADYKAILCRNQGYYISSCVVRRTLLIRAGGTCPMYISGEDWLILLNVARFAQWTTLRKRLSFTRFHTVQITNYDVWDDLEGLGSFVGVWHSGRPLPHRTRGAATLTELAEFGSVYRRIVQGFFWNALRCREWRAASLIRHAGLLLLPRLIDRLYTLIPPPVTWRYEYYILGMYR
jgi:glycosyltransferase involved in cell wall biosynthesis